MTKHGRYNFSKGQRCVQEFYCTLMMCYQTFCPYTCGNELQSWRGGGASLPCFDESFRRNLRTSSDQAVMVLVLVDVWFQSVKNEEASTGRQIIVEYFDATSITRGRSKTFRFQAYILLYFLTVSFKLRFFWIMLVQIDRWDRLNNSEIPKKPSIVYCMQTSTSLQQTHNNNRLVYQVSKHGI